MKKVLILSAFSALLACAFFVNSYANMTSPSQVIRAADDKYFCTSCSYTNKYGWVICPRCGKRDTCIEIPSN